MVTVHDAVQLCLSANRLDLAFSLLKSHLKNSTSELYDTTILLEGTFSNVRQSYSLNQIAYQEYLREIARLNHSVQNLLNDAQQTAALSAMIEKPTVEVVTPLNSTPNPPSPPNPTRKYWLVGGGIGLLLACGVGLCEFVGGHDRLVKESTTATKEPTKSGFETPKAIDSQSVAPSNSAPTPDKSTGKTAQTRKEASKTTNTNGTASTKKEEKNVNEVPKKTINTSSGGSPLDLVSEIELTITLDSDLSDEKIKVDGESAKVLTDGLNVKKILVTANKNHTIVIGGCEKTVFIQKEAKTINFPSCH
jgi:hypothetical protein